MVVTGYEMTKPWVRNDQSRYEMTWVRNDLGTKWLEIICAPSEDSESSLCVQLVANDPRNLHADSEDSDQTGRTPKLIWVLAGCTCHFVGFVMLWLSNLQTSLRSTWLDVRIRIVYWWNAETTITHQDVNFITRKPRSVQLDHTPHLQCHRSTVWRCSSVFRVLVRYAIESRSDHVLFPPLWHLVACVVPCSGSEQQRECLVGSGMVPSRFGDEYN